MQDLSWPQARKYIEANKATASPILPFNVFVIIIYVKAAVLLSAHLTRLTHLFLSEIHILY